MSRRKYFVMTFLLSLLLALNACQHIPNANLALGKYQQGDRKEAWEMINQELANPTDLSLEDRCETHVAAIQILNGIISDRFAPSDPDAIAKKCYEYVAQNCAAFKRKQAITENLYAHYYILTKRTGAAVSHYKRSLQESSETTFTSIMTEHSLGSVYHEMGQFELRDFHRSKAINMARKYFNTKRNYKYSLDERVEYFEYEKILILRMGNLASMEDRTRAVPEMYQLWEEIKEINKKVSIANPHVVYRTAAQIFAEAGELAFARKLLDEARALTKKYLHKDREIAHLDLQYAEATILGEEGKYKEASALFEDWLNNYYRVTGRKLRANDFRLVGLAHESARNYDLAIDRLESAIKDFEKIRSSFEVRSRGQFLSGLTIGTYWGLIRSYAAKYIKERREDDYERALMAERKLRARQFGELLGIDTMDGSADISSFRLTTDELLLNYVFTDKAIVVFAITSDWHDLYIIPYDLRKFNATLRRIRETLSAPGDPQQFVTDLQSLTPTILKPVLGKLPKINKIIVVPDGYLNGIPFGLLSKSQEHYYPMIMDHEVVLFPSVSYMIYQRSQKGQEKYEKSLFALADPAYGSVTIPQDYRDESKEFYTRALGDFRFFTPLPETRIEVENIAAMLPPNSTTKLYGSEANKMNIKNHPLKGYRYLHFATHGILGNQIPGIFEPALILAAGNSFQDSFLTLSDIEGLKVSSDLVVLSACDTGSGKYYTGEGVMGLGRGFLLAGSRSVLASLWPVSSDATVDFMRIFYKNLLMGKTKSESLRLTQLQFLHGKEIKASIDRGVMVKSKFPVLQDINHPFYWAPFVLIGE